MIRRGIVAYYLQNTGQKKALRMNKTDYPQTIPSRNERGREYQKKVNPGLYTGL